MRRLALIGSCLCFAWLGCGASSRVALLELDAPAAASAPPLVEPDAPLELSGAGFPAGQRGQARLTGTLRAPAAAPRRIDVELDAIALSAQRVQLPSAELLAELGARGSFEGRIDIAFEALGTAAGVTLTGSRALAFDFADPQAISAVEQEALRVEADKLLARIGLQIDPDATTHDGVTVRGALPGGIAEKLGIRSGDVLEVASGVRVHALGDLVPPKSASALELQLRRPGTGQVPSVRLPLDAALIASELPTTTWSWLLGWVIACGVLFGSAAPWPLRATRFWSRLMRADARAVRLGMFGAWPPAPERRMRRVLLAMAISFAGVMLVCFEPAALLSVRSITLYLPLVAIGVVLALMQGDAALGARLRAALALLGRMTVMGSVLACACALSGTRALDGIVATQGAWPAQWGGLQSPALLLALPLFVVYGAQIGAAEPGSTRVRTPIGRLVELERVATNVVLSALGAAIFWGGWQSPVWLTLGPWPERLPGALLFVLKAWAMGFCLATLRRSRLALRVSHACALCAAMIALTVLDVWLEPPEPVARIVGQGLCIALGALAAVLVGSLLLGKAPRHDERLWIAAR